MTKLGHNHPFEIVEADLRRMLLYLPLLIQYLPNATGECRSKINDAIEVVQGLSDLWARQGAQRRRESGRARKLAGMDRQATKG